MNGPSVAMVSNEEQGIPKSFTMLPLAILGPPDSKARGYGEVNSRCPIVWIQSRLALNTVPLGDMLEGLTIRQLMPESRLCRKAETSTNVSPLAAHGDDGSFSEDSALRSAALHAGE